MVHLKSLELGLMGEDADTFPFNLPIIKTLPRIEFTSPVTFFVGENGSGKSTLLEATATGARLIAAGSDEVDRDVTLDSVRRLADRLKLVWAKRTRKGFFLRAEDYFGYVKRLAHIRADLEAELRSVDEEFAERPELARGLARMPMLRELHDLQERYGGDLDSYSHGESFFTFFRARFVPDGLYLLDEPEAALSPMRQLAFIALVKELLQHNAQFIIATHSPIILAFPGAAIFSFDQPPLQQVAYDSLEHVTLTRDFLSNPEQFLKHL